MKRPLVVAAGCVLLLTACATPYQEMGLLGGVEAHRVSEDTLQVIARGNAYTDSAVIQRYALRKAAEATLEAGYDLFIIASDNDATRRGAESISTANGSWRSAWATSTTWEMLKPGQTIMVRMLKGAKPAGAPPALYDAHEVVKFMSTGTFIPPSPK